MFKPVETQVAAHHVLFMNELQACIEKPYGRLIIMAPPGSAKSIYTGTVATTWAMGKYPGFKVVSTSYASDPAMRNARRCQQICRSPEYQAIWENKVHLVRGASGVKEWSLTNDSAMLSAGLMGGITSARADLGIIDDPVAGREEADSEQIRRKTKQAYDDDFLTRLKPSASIVIIMTRWHEDDLVGSILPANYKGESGDILCRDGQVWRVVCLPAEAERKDDPLGRKVGAMLWPEWFTTQHWAIYRPKARTWSALYQQRPAPEFGGQFAKGDFKRYRETPKGLKFYMSSDWAVTEKTLADDPDFTQHVMGGINSDGELFLDDGWGKQSGVDESMDAALPLIRRYRPLEWLIESGVIYNATWGVITRTMRESGKKGQARALVPLEKMPSVGDKVAKAAALRAMVKSGLVWVREGSWGDAFIEQCCSFPFGRADDMVDAGGQLARRIDDMFAPKEEPEPIRKRAPKPMSLAAAEWADMDDEEAEAKRRRFMG